MAEIDVYAVEGETGRGAQSGAISGVEVSVIGIDPQSLDAAETRKVARELSPCIGKQAFGVERPGRKKLVARASEEAAALERRDTGEQNPEIGIAASPAHRAGGDVRSEGKCGQHAIADELLAGEGAAGDEAADASIREPDILGNDARGVVDRGLGLRRSRLDDRITVPRPVALDEVGHASVVIIICRSQQMPTPVGKRRAEGHGAPHALVVVAIRRSSLGVDLEASEVGVENEIDHARNRVGTVGCRSASGYDFNTLDEALWNDVNVGSARDAARDTRRHDALSIEQHEIAVRAQAPRVEVSPARVADHSRPGRRPDETVTEDGKLIKPVRKRRRRGQIKLLGGDYGDRRWRLEPVGYDPRTGDHDGLVRLILRRFVLAVCWAAKSAQRCANQQEMAQLSRRVNPHDTPPPVTPG